jgi:hypothetical protein
MEITVDNLPAGEFGLYRKTALTSASNFTVPAGTTVQTPEGPLTAYEESRVALSTDGVYLIAESVFQQTYEEA